MPGKWRQLGSLTAWQWYVLLASPFELQIGVPTGQSVSAADGTLDFNAHAWVGYSGVVLNDRSDIADEFSAFGKGNRE